MINLQLNSSSEIRSDAAADEGKKYPRLLVISANALSTSSNNGKTIESFFRHWPSDMIAQLYFWPEMPTSKVCSNFYRVTDVDMLSSLRRRGKSCGQRVYPQQESCKADDSPAKVYRGTAKNTEIARLLREFMWLNRAWDTPELREWIDAFSPEAVFLCAGGNVFHYRIAETIAKRKKIPIVLFLTDDYVLPRMSASPAYWIRLAWIRRAFLRMCKSTAASVITICDEMSRVYAERFGFKSVVAANSVDIPEQLTPSPQTDGPVKFLYLGGLYLNRWKTLAALGRCIEKVAHNGFDARMEIYCGTRPSERILKKLNISKYCEYKGSLDADGVKRALQEADVLVHVESFDYWNRRDTLLSMSTKIPEYLSTGKCILAVGPGEVASIKHLANTGCAKVVSKLSEQDIVVALCDIILNPGVRAAYGEKAWRTAREYHDGRKVNSIVEKCITDAAAAYEHLKAK